VDQELIEVMRAQVCAIYRAATGTDMPESQPDDSLPQAPFEAITRSFAELEALAQTLPSLAKRVPPFSFTPPLDVLYDSDYLVIELAVPGIERKDVTVECVNETLLVSGIRRGQRGSNDRTCSRGEIPCGPFFRQLRLPFAVDGEPAVELDRGLLRVRIKRHTGESAVEAE
jgi:HSP20 family molecular chaperone IbpA